MAPARPGTAAPVCILWRAVPSIACARGAAAAGAFASFIAISFDAGGAGAGAGAAGAASRCSLGHLWRSRWRRCCEFDSRRFTLRHRDELVALRLLVRRTPYRNENEHRARPRRARESRCAIFDTMGLQTPPSHRVRSRRRERYPPTPTGIACNRQNAFPDARAPPRPTTGRCMPPAILRRRTRASPDRAARASHGAESYRAARYFCRPASRRHVLTL